MDYSKKVSLHIPGGSIELQPLLYNYQENFPLFIFHKLRWFLNGNISILLPLLNFFGLKFTVVNRLGAPGDTLITANVIKCLKENSQGFVLIVSLHTKNYWTLILILIA